MGILIYRKYQILVGALVEYYADSYDVASLPDYNERTDLYS